VRPLHSWIVVLAALSLIAPFASATARPPEEASTLVVESNRIDMKVGEELLPRSWTLDPSGKLDIREVEVAADTTTSFCFISGANSWCRDVRLGDSLDLTIVYEGRSYPTRVVGKPADPQFTADYISRNRGTTEFLIPEAYELANVIISLTPYGKFPNRIFQKSDYYKEVQAHFGPFAGHPIVAALSLNDDKDFSRFIGFRENGAYWTFRGNKLVREGPYRDHWKRSGTNLFAQNIALVEDFAKKSNFRKFFAEHKDYYERTTREFREAAPLTSMIEWLQSRFGEGYRFDSYKVIFSPLVAFSHTAHRGESPEFKESLMFVGAPHIFGRGVLSEAELARMIFTEVDHNFVNPTSDKHRQAIDAAMSNLGDWNDQSVSGGYESPYSTFNEYMTWSVFTLWARDRYEADLFKYVMRLNRIDMIERGFTQFSRFDKALLAAFPAGTTKKVPEIYPEIIDFVRSRQKKE
jgi:hypothetical protein